MKTHEAEAILKYCADIPRRLTIIRRQCAALDDEVDTLKGINMDGMPGGGLPGDSTAAMACKMDELGIGDRLRSLERQQAVLKSDEATIRGQISSSGMFSSRRTMLERMVPEKRKTSCSIWPKCFRRQEILILRMSMPSIKISPLWNS